MSDAYTIRKFVAEAKEQLDRGLDLADLQQEVGERLVRLSERDDLTSQGAINGPSDASFNSYLLWREAPHLTVVLVEFEPYYRSPIHEHGDHWVVAAGYHGADRWDVYERLDDGSEPGKADLELVDQPVVRPGSWCALPPPPRSIHSHNNMVEGFTSELIFSAVAPLPKMERLHFDLDEGTCRESWFGAAEHLVGDSYPAVS
jgi:predicted metal-dependent enzyme (double-stranded beta helix superfamily)